MTAAGTYDLHSTDSIGVDPRRVGLRRVAHMEWDKLRSVRSSWWILAVFAAGMVGIAVLMGATGPVHQDPSYDPTEELFAGLASASSSSAPSACWA